MSPRAPGTRRISGVVLFPGAGSGRDHPSLVAIERALKPLPVSRVDFPYRKAGRRAPDRAPVLMEAVRAAVTAASRRWGVPTHEIVIGGRSMGGRICSMVVADEDDPLPVAGLLLVAYPLDPPRKAPSSRPRPSRTAHLERIDVPTLCVSGTRDAFGSPARLRRAMSKVQGAVTWHWCEARGHDLRGCDDEVAEVTARWVAVSGAPARRRRG